MIFTIDNDNNIIAHDGTPAPQDGVLAFASEKEFTRAVAGWPVSRLVETWNSFAGVPPFDDLKPVKKFENRTIAASRIWNAIQKLAPQPAPGTLEAYGPDGAESAAVAAAETAPANPGSDVKRKPRKSNAAKAGGGNAKAPKPRNAKPAGKAKAPRTDTTRAKVIEMISRKGGATLDEIMKVTGWQAHTVRGFISVLASKGGMAINSTRRESDKARVYEVAR